MEDEEASKFKYEDTSKTRLWLVLSSNAEAAFCVPLTHRIGRTADEVVLTDGSDVQQVAMKGGYLRRLSIDRFTAPGSSLYYTLSRKSLRKAWSIVMYAIMASEFTEQEMQDIIGDAFVYERNCHKNNTCDKWRQNVSCHMGDIYTSNINLNEEALGRVSYMNGHGYDSNSPIIMKTNESNIGGM
jgi:hypothetical protein